MSALKTLASLAKPSLGGSPTALRSVGPTLQNGGFRQISFEQPGNHLRPSWEHRWYLSMPVAAKGLREPPSLRPCTGQGMKTGSNYGPDRGAHVSACCVPRKRGWLLSPSGVRTPRSGPRLERRPFRRWPIKTQHLLMPALIAAALQRACESWEGERIEASL